MNQLYSPYPPYLYLCQVVDWAPQTLRVYLMLWRDFHNNIIAYSEESFEEEKLLSWPYFLEQVRELAYLGFLDFHKHGENHISVTLAKDESI